MYEYTDKVIKYLNRQYIALFGKLKAVTSFDELNILQNVNLVYKKADEITREALYRLAVSVYKSLTDSDGFIITKEWLTDNVLEYYDPVTKYVFVNELDRKRSRLFESLVASKNKTDEINKALRLLSAMVANYAITVTDKVTIKAYSDLGYDKVKWITEHDDRRCKVCAKRDGKIYAIDSVPPKPHLLCRCYLEPVTEG